MFQRCLLPPSSGFHCATSHNTAVFILFVRTQNITNRESIQIILLLISFYWFSVLVCLSLHGGVQPTFIVLVECCPCIDGYVVLPLGFSCEELYFRLPFNEMANYRDTEKLLIMGKLSVLETQVTALSSNVASRPFLS
jgi:hypothetical protein